METKELKVEIPEGYEIDKENSTFECIKFKKKKLLTYEDIAKELFYDKECYYLDNRSRIVHNFGLELSYATDPSNGTSYKQLEKLLAINKLMNVAKYINKNWKPNWNDSTEYKYSPKINSEGNIYITISISCSDGLVFFKDDTLAKQAAEILGKETMRLALSTDW